MIAQLSSVVVLSASFQIAAALVAKYPEVIPGPGLPSLAEIGLTSAQLYQMGVPESHNSIASRAANGQPSCSATQTANVNDIMACYNYLNSLGKQSCSIASGKSFSQFCYAGTGEIDGKSMSFGPLSAPCSDIAAAVLDTVNKCKTSSGQVAGDEYDNAEVRIHVCSGQKGNTPSG